ncbi:hypothetical protein UFOVP1437_19 [uncultured Caudovirales phage]|uniref:Uncharacterized protein n=1 Tax=uncultured Caudovirales phage TaxID=2100421 RepID=A0A6J7XAW4_9CAUD|nr:hypothetical protein UFOVP1437_19 [uncultured Caudovirales phage]CAB5228151.1 hypothetical protein UFOVP1531_45 [uncultured Caudovirales phage]
MNIIRRFLYPGYDDEDYDQLMKDKKEFKEYAKEHSLYKMWKYDMSIPKEDADFGGGSGK